MRCEYLMDDGATCGLAYVTGYPICPGSEQYDQCEDVREAARQEYIERQIKLIKEAWKDRG